MAQGIGQSLQGMCVRQRRTCRHRLGCLWCPRDFSNRWQRPGDSQAHRATHRGHLATRLSATHSCPAGNDAMRRLLVGLVLTFMCLATYAVDSGETLDDPALQARYEQLIGDLRCLVCQNESIADSNAPLAADLRSEERRVG